VTIKNFLEKAQDMCRQYIFDPDEILESRFTRIHLVEKASSIIMGIAQGTNPVDFGTTSDSKQTTLGEQWKEMQQAMKPSLNINVHDVALHFAIRKEINDQGESLRELIEYCFERLLIDFDNRDILTSPQKLCNHVVKAKNPVSHSCLEEDLQKIKSFANSKLAVMRRILDENPFLTDYFSYRIVSDAFKQWDDLQTFLFDIMRFEVLN